MGASLRILSANLWYGRADPEALEELIETVQPDVAVFQELGDATAEAVAECLPYGLLQPGKRASGMGVAARLPAHFEMAPMRGRPMRVARLDPKDWPGLAAPVEVVNVHISAPHSWEEGVPLWVRRRQADDIAAYRAANPAAHRVLLGDFNSTPIWPLYETMTSSLRDAALEVAERQGREPALTWGPTDRSPRMLRIDHAFTEGLRAETFEVLNVAGSDHSAIVLDVALELDDAAR